MMSGAQNIALGALVYSYDAPAGVIAPNQHPWYLDACYSRTVYAIAILTSPLHRVKCALQRGTNISKSDKVVGFPGTVIYIVAHEAGHIRRLISQLLLGLVKARNPKTKEGGRGRMAGGGSH